MVVLIQDINKVTQSILESRPNPIGYQTLFVNSKETQVLAYKYGLPRKAPLELAQNFQQTSPSPASLQISNTDIYDTDLFRYNFGKFFYKFEENATFIDPKPVNLDVLSNISWSTPSQINKSSDFKSPLRYFIGTKNDNFSDYGYSTIDFDFLDDYATTSKNLDLSALEATNQTYINLVFDFNDTTQERTLGDRLRNIGAEVLGSNSDTNLFRYYAHAGKPAPTLGGVDSSYSPQYLGLIEATEIGTELDNQQKFLDHAFTFSHPYSANTQDNFANIKVLYSNVEAKYNFYQESYEKSLDKFTGNVTNTVRNELYYPNLYTVIRESKTDSVDSVNSNYKAHATINGKLDVNILRSFKAIAGEFDIQESTARTGNQYLDEWSNVVTTDFVSAFFNQDLLNVANHYENLIFSPEALKDNEINVSKAGFPFYNEINFNTDTSTRIADILSNSKLFDILVLDYIWQNKTNGDRVFDIDFHPYQSLVSFSAADDSEENLGQQIFNLTPQGNTYRAYDFDQFAEQIKNLNSEAELVQSAQRGSVVSISANGEEFSDESLNIFQSDPLTQLIRKMTFLSNYASVVEENLRTYKEIVEGKQAYNETVFYRVEKRDSAGELIQNFYVLNDSDLNEVSLVDTQIKYGKNYTYQIYAVQLVIGNEYFYSRGTSDPREYATTDEIPFPRVPPALDYPESNEYILNLIANTKQSVKLIELPYTSPATVRLQEAPPVPPSINFVPYVGIDNRVLITFNVGVDEYYDTFIPILEEDREAIENSSIVNDKGQTLFKSEGDVTSFDMFRISAIQMPEGPTSYTDFGIPTLAKRARLNRKLGDPTLIDNILPNTKYWYTFRANDKKHAASDEAPDFSNPTEVYQIEMINNDGAIYLIVETYDVSFFNQQKQILDKQKIKTMRKYLRITPSFDQTLINTTTEEGGIDYYHPDLYASIENYVENNLNEDVSTLKLGYREQSVFGNLDDDINNRFKVRLTSKKTGRKIDIFLRFKKPVLEK